MAAASRAGMRLSYAPPDNRGILENVGYNAILLLMIIIGFILVKRLAGCIIRTIVTLILIGVLAVLYYTYFR